MAIRVALFEDDHELGELFQETMDEAGFKTYSCVSLASPDLLEADVVIGDYRNEIVSFKALKASCKKLNIPLIAISGGDMDFHPQLKKPFLMEDLQALIFKVLRENPPKKRLGKKSEGNSEELDNEEGGFFKDVFGFFKNKG